MTGRADKSARCEVGVRGAFGWASLTIVRKLPTHRAKGFGRLTLMSTFLLPSSHVGTAAMWRAANDKAQTRFYICYVRVSTLEGVHQDVSEDLLVEA